MSASHQDMQQRDIQTCSASPMILQSRLRLVLNKPLLYNLLTHSKIPTAPSGWLTPEVCTIKLKGGTFTCDWSDMLHQNLSLQGTKIGFVLTGRRNTGFLFEVWRIENLNRLARLTNRPAAKLL